MPAVKGKSSLFSKIEQKLKKAVKEHAHDETKLGFVDLPGGLVGIARLTKLYFKEYAADVKDTKLKGQVYLRGEGAIVEVIKGPQNVVGLTTKIGPIPICDSGSKDKPKTLAENVETMLNEFRKLGSDPDTLEAAAEDLSLLEQEAADLVEAGPFFRFKTEEGKVSKEFPNPRIFENWLSTKGLDEYAPPDGSGVQDDSGTASEEGPADVTEEEGTEESGDESEATEDTEAGAEADELDSLAEAADGGDKKAAKKLAEIAKEEGMSAETIEEANSWTHLVDQIREARGGETGDKEAETEEEETPYEPTKNDTIKYKSPKDKKAQEYDVIAVYAKSKTVDLRDTDTKNVVHKAVPWDKLIVIE